MDEITSKIVSNWFRKKYAEIDQAMIPFASKCKKGCDWCCYQSIEILNWEEPLILDFIEKNDVISAYHIFIKSYAFNSNFDLVI